MERGKLTPEIIARAKELDIDDLISVEYRLMPYVHYAVINSGTFDMHKISNEERAILSIWEDKHWSHYDPSLGRINVSKNFWNAMSELIWMGYAYKGE